MPKIQNIQTGEIREVSVEELAAMQSGSTQNTSTQDSVPQITLEQLQQVILDPNISPGTKNRVQQLFELQEKQVEETEEDQMFSQISGIIQNTFNQWESLTEEDKGSLKSLASGISPDIAARQGIISPQAAEYAKNRKAMAGTLKDLVGETGVLTDGDIDRITGFFPTLAAVDEQTNISKKNLNALAKANFGEDKAFFPEVERGAPTQEQAVAPTQEVLPPVQEGGLLQEDAQVAAGVNQSTIPELQGRQVNTQTREPVDVQAEIDRAMEESSIIPLPVLRALAQAQNIGGNTPLLPTAGAVLGSAAGPAGTAAGTIAGRQLQRGLSGRAEGDTFLDSITVNPFNVEERGEAVDDLKAAALAATVERFFKGGGVRGNLAKARNKIASGNTTKISGDKIAEAALEAAENFPTTGRRTAQKKALDAIDKFGGKNLSLKDALRERTASGNIARQFKTGEVRRPVSAQMEEAIRSALRKEIRGTSSTVGTFDDIISGISSATRTGSNIARKSLIPATGIGASVIIGRAINQALGGR